MHKITVAGKIARIVQALRNAQAANNVEWVDRWADDLDKLEADCLPSGSGIDQGTKVDLERSTDRKIVMLAPFHHMDEDGYYDGWTYHDVIVTPTFDGANIRVTGRDRNGIKDYLRETYAHALSREVDAY
jgi:hypothetical protein